jgi:starch-binding outer membrane protein, SusD/RagB family
MKNNKVTYLAFAMLALASCKKSFIDRSTLDGATLTNYYNTAEEVRSATSTLYGLPWAGYENRAMDVIGDVMGGTEISSPADDAPFSNFTVTSTSVRLADAWKSFYKLGGWTSALIIALEDKKKQGGNPAFIDPALAECHFIKGTAYFYIARAWGAAPIINDPGAIALTGNFNIPRYYEKDVLRFALEELKIAEAGLPETDVPGRVNKYSAKGMMAKLYLYTKDYANAKLKAGEVIAYAKSSGKIALYPDYAAMFNTSSTNNHIESLFSTQHPLTQNPWGSANQMQCDRGPDNLQTSEANMWQLYRPSLYMLSQYESGDIRRKGSVMEHGWSKPEWKPKNGNAAYNAFMANGYKYDTLQPTADGGQKNDVHANIAKYVVGPGSTYGGEPVIGMNTGKNTSHLRYADVLLIYAEATLGTGTSTNDAAALEAFNAVRQRAGLAPKTSITIDDILKERRVEFAFEGDSWYDLKRMGFAKASAIIATQNRGWIGNPIYITGNFTQNSMHLPIPVDEIIQDPELAKAPVAYY